MSADLVFLDFEASSLMPGSWPIEIGLSWLERDGVRTEARLIRPAAHWPISAWSARSAEIHGIPRGDLDAAPHADEIARWAFDLINERRLVSDAPAFERRWLKQLFDTIGRETPPILDFDMVAHVHFPGAALDWVYEELERLHVPHRAGPDSARLARAWKRGTQHSDAS